MLETHYDYIIAGAGCAGLSLLMRMLQEPQLRTKKILLIDQSPKNENDRTWCFWEKENGLFEPIVYHQWGKVNFLTDSYSTKLDLTPYAYKMIRGIDFYAYVINYAKRFTNVIFKIDKIKSITTENKKAIVLTEQSSYQADFVFNSILFDKITPNERDPFLLQHFKGWFIETKDQCFNAGEATFMDFTVSQHNGTTFMYVLPTTPNKALIEYTLFTKEILDKEEYDEALRTYIMVKLGITNYRIEHEEFGIIPMTTKKFTKHNGRVINIGIAGGQAKGSSGYVFHFIQKRTEQIVRSLIKFHHPFLTKTFSEKKFHLYDRVLLNVLFHQKMPGDKVFEKIFKSNPVYTVLRFLDNESNLLEDLRIMQSVPTIVFLPAAIKEIFH